MLGWILTASLASVALAEDVTWSESFTIDGQVGDWSASTRIDSGTEESGGAMSWTPTNVYVGVIDGKIAEGDPLWSLMIVLGSGDAGLRTLPPINGHVTPLAFKATRVLWWEPASASDTDGSGSDGLRWFTVQDGGWSEAADVSLAVDLNAVSLNDVFEVRIRRGDLGIVDDTLRAAVVAFRQAGTGVTGGNTLPGGAFVTPTTTSTGPGIGRFLSFDLTAGEAPSTYTPLSGGVDDVDLGTPDDTDAADDTDVAVDSGDTGGGGTPTTPGGGFGGEASGSALQTPSVLAGDPGGCQCGHSGPGLPAAGLLTALLALRRRRRG